MRRRMSADDGGGERRRGVDGLTLGQIDVGHSERTRRRRPSIAAQRGRGDGGDGEEGDGGRTLLLPSTFLQRSAQRERAYTRTLPPLQLLTSFSHAQLAVFTCSAEEICELRCRYSGCSPQPSSFDEPVLPR
ncbi:hypothetical protein Q1695_000443 [Nippostrongylus brasiliensis]|nr:hypothetical protein Q1695_000443 [Nippostrongylus brasiliensis]